MPDALDKLYRLANGIEGDAVVDGMCFVPLQLYHDASAELFLKLRAEGRPGNCWYDLIDAGIPNFLCCGCWIVPEQHKEVALATQRVVFEPKE